MTKRQLVKFITFPVVVALIIIFLSNIFITPGTVSYFHFALYYKETKNTLDFVAIGPSTVFSGFIPTYAWDEYGYTGYNFSSSMQHVEVTKMALTEVMRTQNPKAVMIDINNLTYSTAENSMAYVKEFFDSIPNSKNKRDLMAKYNITDELDTPLYKYHGYWANLTYLEYVDAAKFYSSTDAKAILKGFATRCYKTLLTVIDPNDPLIRETYHPEYTGRALSEYSINNLLEMLDYCAQFPDTKFNFVKMPRFLTTENVEAYYQLQSAWEIIRIYNEINGTNFFYRDFSDDIGEGEGKINLKNDAESIDFFDFDHMNYYGALKFTDYISNLLISQGVFSADSEANKTNYTEDTINNFNDSYIKSVRVFDSIVYYLEVSPGDTRISEVTAYRINYMHAYHPS